MRLVTGAPRVNRQLSVSPPLSSSLTLKTAEGFPYDPNQPSFSMASCAPGGHSKGSALVRTDAHPSVAMATASGSALHHAGKPGSFGAGGAFIARALRD